MSRYDLLGLTGSAASLAFFLAVAVLAPWCLIHIVRHFAPLVRDAVARFPFRPARHGVIRTHDDWIAEWEHGRSDEATRARITARLRGGAS